VKKISISLAFVATVLGLLKFWPSSMPPSTPAPSPVSVLRTAESTPKPLHLSTTTESDSRKAGSPLAAELNSPSYDARHDVATLHTMLRQYLRITQRRPGPPIGNDSDLARAFTGHNPMKLVVLPASHPALTPDGRLRDRWETPYFIHPRGHLAFEIRSAGPDLKLFTADDLVENPEPGRTSLANLPPE
jgi:hypothetical protein